MATLLLSAQAAADTWDSTADTVRYTANIAATNYTTTAEQLAGLAELVNGGNTATTPTIELLDLKGDVKINFSALHCQETARFFSNRRYGK